MSKVTNISNGNRRLNLEGGALSLRRTAPQLRWFREGPALGRGGAVEGICSLRDGRITRDQATIADDTEEEQSDCWPDWGGRVVVSPDTIQELSRENSPARVFFEIGVILATASVLVLAAPLFAPPL
jgi:hypothetical protein